MKKYRFFKCQCGNVDEKYIDDNVSVINCKCGGVMKRQISAPRYFGNSTGKSPARL